MGTKLNPSPQIFGYTQHVQTIKALELHCGINIELLPQDRTKDPTDDVLSRIPPAERVILYAVLPVDKAIELKQKAPWIRLFLMQLDGKTIEQLTGAPYDPKREYPSEIVLKALKIFEIKSGTIRYMTFEELKNMLEGKTVAVFNDTMRTALSQLIQATFTKTCQGSNCIEVNPLGHKPGVRISFPGNIGKLDASQMAELIRSGVARIYYVEVDAAEVPPCPQ